MSAKHASGDQALSPPDAPQPAQPHPQPKPAAQQPREGDAFFAIFAWRLLNAYCVRTFFQPDEYFQALEPAWQMAFGQGQGAWLTWEWQYQLRSSLHPAIFAIGYYLVDNSIGFNGRLKAMWLLAAPKVIQAGIAALGDWLSWRLARKLYGSTPAVAWSVLLMTLANPWQWYTSTRAFSNCLEATLTCSALYYWPWELLGSGDDKKAVESTFMTWSSLNSLRMSLVSAALAVLLRPTSALLWLALGTVVLTRITLDGKSSPLTWRVILILFREISACGSVALGLCVIADRQYYGEWTYPALNLMYFNVAQDLAVFYGINDWHYYLSQGIPLLCTTLTPFVLKGLVNSTDPNLKSSWSIITANSARAMTYMVSTMISSLSFITHKEVRFITPLLPMLHILAAPYVTDFFTTALEAKSAGGAPSPVLKWKRKPLLVLGLVANVIIGGYLATFHSGATIGVTTFLREEFEAAYPDHLSIPLAAVSAVDDGDDSSSSKKTPGPLPDELFAYFLTPCHATPWRSHLIYPALRAGALSCDPPVLTAPGSAERASYRDETSRFYDDPATSLRVLWGPDTPHRDLPRYIVAYEGLAPMLLAHFGGSDPEPESDQDAGPGPAYVRLTRVWSAWNGLFTDDDRKAGRLEVWQTTDVRDQLASSQGK